MRERGDDDHDVAQALETMHRAGHTSWPAIEISATAFERHLAKLAGQPLTVSWLFGRPAADLYLACACADRQPVALAAFDTHYLSRVRSFLAHMRPDAVFVDECRQVLREKLFAGATPKIAEYTGRGSLLGWLRVVTARTALNLTRRPVEPLAGPCGVFASAFHDGSDPEYDYLKDRYRETLRTAIEHSFTVLPSEQRNLLRLHFLDGMTLHQLATLFHVHRATVARWIAQARQHVLEGTRVHLQRELALKTAELDSMMRLLDSKLELNMRNLLGTAGP